MKKTFPFILFFFTVGIAFPWGFWGHKKINRMAVFTLPPGMIGFYKHNIDYLIERSVAADKRRHSDKEEAPKHYIDLDHYGAHPFDSIPKRWNDAVARYSEDSLKAHGIVPWQIEKLMFRLTEAFKNKDADKILYLSADLGHYIADAHVPLHCTRNYNGQLTGQTGIHGFWETRLPELYGDSYEFFTGRAHYIDHPLNEAWNMVRGSSSALDSVLNFEAELNRTFPSDQKYSYENKAAKNVKVYSEEYSRAYNQKLNGMVERRMQAAVSSLGNFWYTAWVNAGQPDLDKLLNKGGLEERENNMDTLRISIEGHED
jgi:hypothetical protein